MSNEAHDQGVAAQTHLDDVGKVIHTLQRAIHKGGAYRPSQEEWLKVILCLAQEVLALETCASNSPTEYTQDPSTEKQSKPPKPKQVTLFPSEQELILYMRSEGLSADKLTTYLSSVDLDLCLLVNALNLREET